MPTNEEQLPITDEHIETHETHRHPSIAIIMSSSSALDTALSRACACDNGEVC